MISPSADPSQILGLVVVGDLIGSGVSQEQAIVGETPKEPICRLIFEQPVGFRFYLILRFRWLRVRGIGRAGVRRFQICCRTSISD
jgi:hypothetical protein